MLSVLLSHAAVPQNHKFKDLLAQNSGTVDTIIKIHSKDNMSAEIPATLIIGAKKGPTFTIIAGIHGMEYPTILSLLELRKEINPNELSGNLIILPIVNTNSFFKRTPFVNPIDNLNLNRVFPGNPEGSITEVMADFITKDLYDVTDILLDMHGGDVGEDLVPFICYYDNKEFINQTEQVKRLSAVSGFETVVSYPYILENDQPALYAFKQAVRQGIPALSIEIGKLGNYEKSEVNFTKDAIYRMLQELKMYEKTDLVPAEKVKSIYNQQAYVSVPEKGIFFSDYKAGDKVVKNQSLGHITDLLGNKINEIKAPATGTILYKVGTPPVNKGETLFCIGY